MNQKQIIFIFILLFIFAKSIFSATTLEKPWEKALWEKENPFIVYIEDKKEWLVEAFDSSIDSLNLENIDSDAIEVQTIKKKIIDAKDEAELLKITSAHCSVIKKEIQSNYLALNINDDCIKILVAFPAYSPFILRMWNSGLNIIWCTLDWILKADQRQKWEAQYKKNLNALESCSNKYASEWKNTMSWSIDALSSSLIELEEKWSEARNAFEKLKYAGICEQDYKGPEASKCTELKYIFYTTDINATTNKSYIYTQIWSNITQIKNQLIGKTEAGDWTKFVPQDINLDSVLMAIWAEEGAISLADELKQEAMSALVNAKKNYRGMRSAIKNDLDSLEKKIQEMKNDKLNLINEVAQVMEGAIYVGEEGTIRIRFEDVQSSIENIKNDLIAAESIYKQITTEGYIKNATKNLNNIKEELTKTNILSDRLKQDAEATIESLHNVVLRTLEEFELLTKEKLLTTEVKSLYEDAKKDIEKAKSSVSSLGNRYINYNNAKNKLSIATTLFYEKPAEIIAAMRAKITKLKTFIAAAKVDEIEVSLEENLLELISENPGAWIGTRTVQNLNGMEQNIIKKAQAKWGFLKGMRKNLLEQIKLGGHALSDLKTSIVKAEKLYIDSVGHIKWKEAIGKLKTIYNEYIDVESQITKNEYAIITANGLIVNNDLFIGAVELDKPTTISLDIFIKNRYPYRADKVSRKIPSTINWLESNIVKGNDLLEAIASDGSTIILYMKTIEPYATYEIKLEKNEIIAQTISKKTTVRASPDFSAIIYDEVGFLLDYDVRSLSFDLDYLNANNVKVDGLEGPTFNGLKKGKHTLTYDYVYYDAYTYETANYNAKKDPFNPLITNVQYDLIFTPTIDITELSYFVEKPLDAQSFSVSSLSWEKITDKTDIGNGLYRFKIQNLKKEKPVSVRISYTIKNVADYINKELTWINPNRLSENANKTYVEVQNAVAANNSNNAIVKLQELKAKINKEKTESEKHTAKYKSLANAIETEKNNIEKVVSDLKDSHINIPITTMLEKRVEYLNETLKDATKISPSSAVELLNAVDKEWTKKKLSAIKKKVFGDYSTAKKKLLNITGKSDPQFNAFENAYAVFEATNNVRDLPEVLIAQQAMNQIVTQAEEQDIITRNNLSSAFNTLKESVTLFLTAYSKEKSAAHGTPFKSIFSLDNKNIQKRLANAETAFKKGKTTEKLKELLSKVQEDAQSLNLSLSSLEIEAEHNVNAAEEAYAKKIDSLSDESKKTAEQYLTSAKTALAEKKYVNALKASDKVLSVLKSSTAKSDDKGFILLALTALFILGVITIYIVKQSKNDRRRIGNEAKTQYKKLARIKDTPPTK